MTRICRGFDLTMLIGWSAVFLLHQSSCGQVPFDGVPDVYLVADDTFPVPTTAGPLVRPAGTLLLDTDGNHVIAISIAGPDVITGQVDDGSYLVGVTSWLPDVNALPPLFASAWESVYVGGRSEWTRTSPTDTPGFVGVTGQHSEDVFDLFPDVGLSSYSGDLMDFGTARITYGDGSMLTVPVCGQSLGTPCTPEPSAAWMVVLGLVLAPVGRRSNTG